MYIIVLALLLFSCNHRQSHHLDSAAIIMQRNDRELARKGLFEFMTVPCHGPLIGDFKKHYITKRYQLCDVNQARNFFCSFIDTILTPLNCEKSLRPYLQNYPLTFQDFDLQIVFIDERDCPLLEPYFCSIRKVGEKIYYERFDPEIQKSVAICIEQADRAYRIYKAGSVC